MGFSELFADSVKSVAGVVGGQLVLNLKIEPSRIADRVSILYSVQAANSDFFPGLDFGCHSLKTLADWIKRDILRGLRKDVVLVPLAAVDRR